MTLTCATKGYDRTAHRVDPSKESAVRNMPPELLQVLPGELVRALVLNDENLDLNDKLQMILDLPPDPRLPPLINCLITISAMTAVLTKDNFTCVSERLSKRDRPKNPERVQRGEVLQHFRQQMMSWNQIVLRVDKQNPDWLKSYHLETKDGMRRARDYLRALHNAFLQEQQKQSY